MPLLFPAFPAEAGAIGAAAPVTTMSLKSIPLDPAAKAATAKVLCVPITLEAKKVRHVTSVPAARVRVPLIVWLAENVTAFVPLEVLPVMERLLNVFAPVIVKDVLDAEVNDTL